MTKNICNTQYRAQQVLRNATRANFPTTHLHIPTRRFSANYIQNMKATLCLLAILSALNACRAHSAATCPSAVPEGSRKDCFPDGGSTEQGCVAKGCMWCEASYDGPPWCFFDDDGSGIVTEQQ